MGRTGIQETPVLQGGHMLDGKKVDLGIKETKAQVLALPTPCQVSLSAHIPALSSVRWEMDSHQEISHFPSLHFPP